jgi:hypothetical protein
VPVAGSRDVRSRAELQWTAALTALEVGDDDAAVSAHQGLAPLLDEIGDPYLDSLSHLAVAWTSPIVGDFDGALERAADALELLRPHDEPFWTAMAFTTAGTIELSVRRYDQALPHLTAARDLAERSIARGKQPRLASSLDSSPPCRAGSMRATRCSSRRSA